jgi:ABC-2 type transport system permease protein
MSKALVIAMTDLRRTFRMRTNIFFVFIFPILLILIMGVTFGGQSIPRVGIVSTGSGTLGQQLLSQFEKTPSISVESIPDSNTLQTDVERGDLAAGVVIPAGYDSAIRSGHAVVVTYLARPDQTGQRLGETIRSVVAGQSEAVDAAQFVVAQRYAPTFDAGLAAANQAASSHGEAISVSEQDVGTGRPSSSPGQYAEGAWGVLVLFIFLVTLTGGALSLIETRRLGISRRMLSTPTTSWTVIAGGVVGLLLVAIVQAAVVIGGSALMFGVRWGDPLGVVAVVILFALVSVGTGRLVGTLFSNEQQAVGVTLLLGLGLAALGGSMAPLEIFSPTMKQIAHVTPHAWANDAFAQLVGHGATIAQIVPQLGVLAAFAVVLLTLATWRFHRVLIA